MEVKVSLIGWLAVTSLRIKSIIFAQASAPDPSLIKSLVEAGTGGLFLIMFGMVLYYLYRSGVNSRADADARAKDDHQFQESLVKRFEESERRSQEAVKAIAEKFDSTARDMQASTKELQSETRQMIRDQSSVVARAVQIIEHHAAELKKLTPVVATVEVLERRIDMISGFVKQREPGIIPPGGYLPPGPGGRPE